jgi:hypothetical protein
MYQAGEGHEQWGAATRRIPESSAVVCSIMRLIASVRAAVPLVPLLLLLVGSAALVETAGVGTKWRVKVGVLLLLLQQVAHTPALPVSATMRTMGAGRVTVDARWRVKGDDAEDDDADADAGETWRKVRLGLRGEQK